MYTEDDHHQVRLVEYELDDGSTIICSPDALDDLLKDIEQERQEALAEDRARTPAQRKAYAQAGLRLVVDNTPTTKEFAPPPPL